jgi:hypothetical protein
VYRYATTILYRSVQDRISRKYYSVYPTLVPNSSTNNPALSLSPGSIKSGKRQNKKKDNAMLIRTCMHTFKF